MAMIKCPECGQEISDKAKKCIHCGCPVKGKSNRIGKIIIPIIVVIVILVGVAVALLFSKTNSDKTEETKEMVTQTETQITFEDYELAAINMINKLKDLLKNPDSLTVYSIHVRQFGTYETTYHFCIDYSAQNGFGGNNRKTEYLEIGKTGDFAGSSFDSLIMAMEENNYKKNPNILDKELDVDKIMNNLDKNK
jgi:hypothetical protein|uniref:zinc ribbon domain-containing protein n=1 Tax=Lachnospira eligens TaxID=39485 RepID=UPI003FF013E8